MFDGLSWQNCTTSKVRSRLNELNHVRNSIAHGATTLRVNDRDYNLTLAQVRVFRSFAGVFATYFYDHALAKL